MSEEAFIQFIQSRHSDLRRIGSHSREHSLEDVQAEAWLMVKAMHDKGIAIDLRQPDHQKLLLSHLYQHLVRYTEQTVRKAVRLDHAPGGEVDERHPLADLLKADEQSEPVTALMRMQTLQEQVTRENALNAHQSLAAAYLTLLQRFNNRMEQLADYLMISLSYCYRRCAHARILAIYQQALPAAAMIATPDFVPGAWRCFRLLRVPEQLSFDFDLDHPLFSHDE